MAVSRLRDLLTEVRGRAKGNLNIKIALHFGGEIVT
jgi:hypothetical protein